MLDNSYVVRSGPVIDVNNEASVLGRNLRPTMGVTLQARVMNQLTSKVALWPLEDTPAGW